MAGRPKTELRVALEEYFAETDPELVDDWFTWPVHDRRDACRVRSMLHQLKKVVLDAADAVCIIDLENRLAWIHW